MNKMAKAMLGFAGLYVGIAAAPVVGAAVGMAVAGAGIGGTVGLVAGFLLGPVPYAIWDSSGPSVNGKPRLQRATESLIGLYANTALLAGTLAVGVFNVLKKPFVRKKAPPPAYGERPDFSIKLPLPDLNIDFGQKAGKPAPEKAPEVSEVKQKQGPKA